MLGTENANTKMLGTENASTKVLGTKVIGTQKGLRPLITFLKGCRENANTKEGNF